MTRLDLIAAGWTLTRSGRWTHSTFPGEHGRRRVFTEAEALTLLGGDTAPDTRTVQQIGADAVTAAFRIDAQLRGVAEIVQYTCDDGIIR